jgi:hypothetical protein
MNRCLAINPEETTRYTLTATGAGGQTETASFVLQVDADADRLPKILYFLKGRKQKEGDRTHTCAETRNAAMVSGVALFSPDRCSVLFMQPRPRLPPTS